MYPKIQFMILKYVLKSKKDNKTWFDVIHLYPVVLNKTRLNGEFSHSYIIPETKVTYNECTVQWESTTEQNIMMSAKWCHGCATLHASIAKPMSLRRFCFLWVQTNWPDYRAYCLDLSHRTNIEINKIKLLNNHAISFTNLSVIFF